MNSPPKKTWGEQKPQVLSARVIGQGHWLKLEELTWLNPRSGEQHWERVVRSGERSAVLVVARCVPSGDLILVEQFRPALGHDCIEFPAGLVDEGEDDGQAALRELLEETGYYGELVRVVDPKVTSPGVSSESIAMAFVNVDESDPRHQNPQKQLEESEWLRSFRLPREQWSTLLEHDFKGHVDAKLAAFIAGSEIHG